MLLTKTQVEIMKIFASKITKKFSIREISMHLKKPYPMVYRSTKELIAHRLIIKDERGLLSLNYKNNHSTISYVESQRKEAFLEKNKTIALFAKDIQDRIKHDFFIILVFGSAAAGRQKPRDIDILLIVSGKKDADSIEKILDRASSSFTTGFHCNVISAESASEMLIKRDKINIVNETLDNHILIYGAENYYRLIKYAR